MDRRKFFKKTSLAGAGVLVTNKFMTGTDAENTGRDAIHLMEEGRKYRKNDCHAHVYLSEDSPATQLDVAERIHIDRLVISRNRNPTSERTPEEFRKKNDLVIQCMKDHPDRLLGTMVLNPKCQKESLHEIDRCVGAGMVGAGELYTQ